jgi:hypothetical protein
MAKYTKTFNIGEYAQGGVITAEVEGKKITIIGREWDFSKGSLKSSDQTNSPEFTRLEVHVVDDNSGTSERKLIDFLSDLTTSYYTDEIMKWIKTKITFPTNLYW